MGIASTDKLVHYVGDSARMSGCHFVANFTNGISVSWLKDGNVTGTETAFNSSWNSNSFLVTVEPLHLSNIDFKDSGNYSCRLTYNTTRSAVVVESPRIRLLVQSMLFFRDFAFGNFYIKLSCFCV